MKSTLTPAQTRLLEYLKARRTQPPTYREAMDDLGYVSTSQIARLMKQLCERGYIKMPAGKARCYVFL